MKDKTDKYSKKIEESLGSLRAEIDLIDDEIVQLINKRAGVAKQVAEVKMSEPLLSQAPVFFRPEREAQILRRVLSENPGPLEDKQLLRVFREIMSSCLALESPLTVAYLGPQGTFTQAAVNKHFGSSICSKPLVTIDDIFREVESSSVHYGVVPVENSTEGMVNHTLDNLIDSELYICGEIELKIHQSFMANKMAAPDEIIRVYSHEQSLAQCRKWLDNNYPNIERIPVSSNAEGAKRATEDKQSAAIASNVAAELYGLTILANNIEDFQHNSTRFLVIGHDKVAVSGNDKTSFVVSARNKPGALYEILHLFHESDISLTRVETRPSREGTWAYVFFIDFEGHQNEEPAKSVMRKLESQVVELKSLGSYPKALV